MIEKLDFSKVTKEHLPYTIFLNSVIQQIHNAETLAIWVYLYSLPPDWSVNKQHLKTKFNLGNAKLRKIFSYLRRARLLEYRRPRNNDGTLGAVAIHILAGTEFNADEPFDATESEIDSLALPLGQKSTPVVNHTRGSETLQKKHINKINKKEKKKHENCLHEQIIALYHEILPMCRAVKIWNKTRQGLLKQRWAENEKHQSLDFWRKYFEHVKESNFLIGRVPGRDGKRPFVADLEWLIKPNNFAKVIEGKYHSGDSHD